MDQGASMQNLFQLGDSERAQYIAGLLHYFGFSYICLWLHAYPQNYLQCHYGYYPGDYLLQQQASSSYGGLARRLFDEYRTQTIFLNDHTHLVPGVAFKRRNPCMILRELDLQQLASSDIQRQFYLEARIQTAVFMGCRSGEIELGFSIVPQNLEMELRKLFPEDFPSMDHPLPHMPTSLQDAQHSSSSSRSLDSPEYPPFLFNLSTMREAPAPLLIKQTNTTTIPISLIHSQPNPSTHQSLPTPEIVDTAIANAILASLTSHTTSPSTVFTLPPRAGQGSRFKASAFRSCSSTSSPRIRQPRFQRQNVMKKVLAFYRVLNVRRLEQQQASQQLGGGLSRPTSTQLHHVMSERKRREKINESFQALRSLLPPGTKKDKATVLRTTKEYMRSLQDQISELTQRNQLLESKIHDTSSSPTMSSPDASESVHVQLTPVAEPSSSMEEQRMDLRVSVQGEGHSMIDLILRLLDFLKGVHHVRLASMEAQNVTLPSHQQQQQQHQQQQQQQQRHNSSNRVTLRLVIEGNEWDQSAFLEAVRRVIADLAH